MNTTIIKDQETIMEEIRKQISGGHHVTIMAKGYSMNPFIIHKRDSIMLGPWTESDIKRGKVALVQDIRGKYVIHRILQRDGDRIVLMGDGNVKGTETAHTDSIIGLMTGRIRNGETLSCCSWRWKASSWIWNVLRPIRRWPLALWRRLVRQEPLQQLPAAGRKPSRKDGNRLQ
ncbi:MAG: S24/S26 family peptidase [Bacteroidales bacterium]|nr:S24/S26 family peptidase [Bacteroidales bacterium]